MPSLILTGHPCTLKTTFARLLSQRALRHPSGLLTDVIHITESNVSTTPHTKAQAYQNSPNEKTGRAALKSAFDRALSSDSDGSTLVLLDSLNYIKGYRYELYCISKAAGQRHGVIWITGSDGNDASSLAKERNRRRRQRWEETANAAAASGENGRIDHDDDDDGYYQDDATMDELVLRLEPPDERNRWENPLYKVDMSRVLPWGKNGTLKPTDAAENDVASLMQSTASAKVPDVNPAAVRQI
jgi:protein KTI12